MSRNSFLIINAATAENIGTQWLLLCRKNNQLLFAEPLVSSFHRTNTYIKNLLCWQKSQYLSTLGESTNSECKLKTLWTFCIYTAHFVFNAQKHVNISDNELIRFAFHMMF